MQNETIQARSTLRLPILLLWIAGTTAGWALGIVPLIMALNGVFWSGSFETITTSYYDGSYWPKAVEAPGSWPAMVAGWVAGGLALGIISGIAMKILTNNTTNSPVTMENQ